MLLSCDHLFSLRSHLELHAHPTVVRAPSRSKFFYFHAAKNLGWHTHLGSYQSWIRHCFTYLPSTSVTPPVPPLPHPAKKVSSIQAWSRSILLLFRILHRLTKQNWHWHVVNETIYVTVVFIGACTPASKWLATNVILFCQVLPLVLVWPNTIYY